MRVIARASGKKLFLMWPANEHNLAFMRRRARGETPIGWEDGPISIRMVLIF